MPGPGGGSRGGGGHFGGGGGFRGGGHHGGYHGGGYYGGYYPRRFGGFWGFGYGGGCMSVLLMPFILIVCAAIVLFGILGGAFGSIAEGGITDYEEIEFQQYADAEYAKAFGSSTAYEDNILLVVLTNEDADEVYYIAWVGDHIKSDIRNMFGNEYTELGSAIEQSINVNGYWYSLDTDLAAVVDKMADYIEYEGLSSSFTCNENHNQVEPSLINYGEFELSETAVETALRDFTDRTGITLSIVVNDMDEVFGLNYSSMIIGIILVVVLVGAAVFFVIKGIRNRRGASYRDDENPFN